MAFIAQLPLFVFITKWHLISIHPTGGKSIPHRGNNDSKWFHSNKGSWRIVLCFWQEMQFIFITEWWRHDLIQETDHAGLGAFWHGTRPRLHVLHDSHYSCCQADEGACMHAPSFSHPTRCHWNDHYTRMYGNDFLFLRVNAWFVCVDAC